MNISTLTCKKCKKEFKLRTSFGTRMDPQAPDADTPPNVAVANYTKKIEEEADRFLDEIANHECNEFVRGKIYAC